MLTQTQLHSLQANGFLLLPTAFPQPTITHLLTALSDLPPAHAHRNLLQHPAIKSFANSPEARALITPALGQHAFPVRGILFDKLPTANWKVAWHQDLSIAVKLKHDVPHFGPWSIKDNVPHVQPPAHILESMLTLRLHLDDCFQDNGPVRVLPTSHTRGILSPDQIHQLRTELPETLATGPAGSVLLMRPLILHASSAATNPNHRRVIHIEFAANPLPHPLEWFEQ